MLGHFMAALSLSSEAVRKMATTGVMGNRLYTDGSDVRYGLANVAAFLAQTLQETIQYDACDENNWSDANVAASSGGTVYPATSACGLPKFEAKRFDIRSEAIRKRSDSKAKQFETNAKSKAIAQLSN